MQKIRRALIFAFLALGGCPAPAQNSAIAVVPSKATMLVGEAHTFRAVGSDGQMRHHVRWSATPSSVVTLSEEGDEVTVQAGQPFSSVTLTAYSEGASAQAGIEIRTGETLPLGTVKWSVKEMPGCKSTKITPAVPSAGGPDIYEEEWCPQGTFVRAITDDGRELWHRRISGPQPPPPSSIQANQAPPATHITSAHSICDEVSAGATKQIVLRLAGDRSLPLGDKERGKDSWVLEEQGFECDIYFDRTGTVVRKRKTILAE
jgi:hypothetical protein